MLSISQTVYITEYNVDRVSRHGATVAVDLAGTNSRETCGIQLDVETWRQVIAAVAPLVLCHDAEVKAEAEAKAAEEAEAKAEFDRMVEEIPEQAQTDIAAIASVMS